MQRETKPHKEEHSKRLILIDTTKEDWKQYSLWGRFGMRIAQIIGLLEIKIK